MSLKGRCGRLISSEASFRATGVRHPKAAVDTLTFPVNTSVLIQGLQNAPQYNGQGGTVVRFDEGCGRYNIRLDEGSTIALKPGNVVPVSAGAPVEPNESCPAPFDPALAFVEVSFRSERLRQRGRYFVKEREAQRATRDTRRVAAVMAV